MDSLPAMQVFRDVPVVPVTRMSRSRGIGGPIWPDFDQQVAVRFCRDGTPSDIRPRVAGRLRPMRRAATWGGFLIRQFGHLVAEQLTRLPQSLNERPWGPYLFTVEPGETAETLPTYIWDVLEWFGLRRRQIELVTQGYQVAELHVAAQGEMLGKQPISPAYLALLEARAFRNALEPVVSDVVFVTRAGMAARGQGAHLGEGYLAQVLQSRGVLVIEPGSMPLRQQLAVYAGARVLVFAEGSAQHGRCILGRLPQDIHVLRRRSRRNTAIHQLRVRCHRIAYHEAVQGSLGSATETHGSRVDLEAALYDMKPVLALFALLGVNLDRAWNPDAYRAAVKADVAGWMAANPVTAQQHAANLNTLAKAGHAHDFPFPAGGAQVGAALS